MMCDACFSTFAAGRGVSERASTRLTVRVDTPAADATAFVVTTPVSSSGATRDMSIASDDERRTEDERRAEEQRASERGRTIHDFTMRIPSPESWNIHHRS